MVGMTRRQLTASTAKLTASIAITHTGPTPAMSRPASGGPTIVAAWPRVPSSAFAARWCRCGSSSATSVNRPADPHGCNSEDTASRTT
ncbi:hypothetical protein A8711_23950 [Micromonospora sp. II]|nr:hypothetical protein A8711_23950 [Micromonospora sp. II]